MEPSSFQVTKGNNNRQIHYLKKSMLIDGNIT